MADNKTKAWFPALAHATIYSLPFFLIGSWKAVLVIWATHYLIDRYRLARYVCWAKNWIAPKEWKFIAEIPDWRHIHPQWPWKACVKTGYPPNVPDWLSVWLLIIADNTLHLTINYVALLYL
jgi:hypothetical protein